MAGGICSSDGWCWANPTPQGHWLYGIWVAPGGDVWACGMYGTILRYRAGKWAQVPSGTANTVALYSIWGSADDDIWAVGSGGTIVHYDGNAWSPVASSTTQELYGIWGSGRGSAWAAGWAGTIVRLTGSTWTTESVPGGVTDTLAGVWGSSATDVWVVGANQRILHFDGVGWTSQNYYYLGGNFAAVGGSSATNVWAVGGNSISSGMVFHFDGTRWTQDNDVQARSAARDLVRARRHRRLGGGRSPASARRATIWRISGTTITSALTAIEGSFLALGGRNATSVWAAGAAGGLLRFESGAWSRASETVVNDILLVWGVHARRLRRLGGGDEGHAAALERRELGDRRRRHPGGSASPSTAADRRTSG